MSWIYLVATAVASGAICGACGAAWGMHRAIQILLSDSKKSETIRQQMIDRSSEKIAAAWVARTHPAGVRH